MTDQNTDNFEKYSEYNRILRSWFVAFGIGGPAVFLVNDAIRSQLVQSGEMKVVALLFLLGVAAQIAIVLLNKTINWYIYQEAEDSMPYKVSLWVNDQFWIDITLDLLTFGAFGCAVWKIFTVFAN